MEFLRAIANVWSGILPNIFASDDTDIMSSETRKILSNDEDRKKYLDAVRELRLHPDKPQTIVLSNKEQITLTR